MKASKTALLVETLARKTVKASANVVPMDAAFTAQQLFVEDTAKFIAAQCSRRAGKTNGLVLRFFKTMEKHPKSQCLYLSLTQDSAREIIWPVLQEMNDKYQLGCTFTESKLEMKHPNGSRLKVMGADLKDFVKRLKGRKYPGVAIDESQDMGSHLQSLIDDVLTPSIADYPDGWLALTGTPGPVPAGFFFDVTNNGKYGFKVHKWTMLDNPHMPDPAGFIAGLKARREWADDNATLRREYRNEWVLDTDSLWVKYSEKLNHYQELPKEHKWQYVMGVDLGYNDADAIAILAWAETSATTYLVEECIQKKQGISDLILQIEALQKKYSVYKIVMDEGGLGKKIAEDLRQRFACPIQPAEKAHKQSNVEFLNDYMRLGKFKAKSGSRFALDSFLVQIDWDRSTPNRIVVKKKPHSDIIDAVLYAFRESYSYTYKPPQAEPAKWGTKEWADQQTNTMFDLELEGMQQEDVYKRWLNGED